MTPTSNPSASIHQRILNKAAAEQRPFNELLQYYAIERFLFRLGQSPYKKQFILKGALVFLAWQVPLTRPTRDIDFLGFTENSIDNLVRIIRQVCSLSLESDGIVFVPDSVKGEMIKENADYHGIRIEFLGFLGKAKVNMRLDVGFADVVTPAARELELPTIFETSSKPCIWAYPPETVVAEKFQAMVALGMVNSRMKDFYDLWYLTDSLEFDLGTLQEAVMNTFRERKTSLPKEAPDALRSGFAALKQTQWVGFLKKNRITGAPTDFILVIERLKKFFDPIIQSDGPRLVGWYPNVGWR